MLNKKKLIAIVAIMMIPILTLGLMTGCKKKEEKSQKKEPVEFYNPLTGASGYDKALLKNRPVAIVVENHPDARPQWGMTDENFSPDIIVHGEVEGGITRTLWFWADDTKLPEIVGPIRSARPPFIKFSELFDAVFIHWGFSHTSGGYIGADTVFAEDEVDHIDNNGATDIYDRDTTRNVDSEHRGTLYGNQVAEAIDSQGFRAEKRDVTELEFYKKAKARKGDSCGEITVNFSSESEGWMSTNWVYNSEDQQYHTNHFENNLGRTNVIVLFDETEYITNDKATYCNYLYTGGRAVIASMGVVQEVKWKVVDGKLVLYREVANEKYDAEKAKKDSKYDVPEFIEETVKLNPGKSYIGLASSNNGGSVQVKPIEEPAEDKNAEDKNAKEAKKSDN